MLYKPRICSSVNNHKHLNSEEITLFSTIRKQVIRFRFKKSLFITKIGTKVTFGKNNNKFTIDYELKGESIPQSTLGC